MHDHGPDDLYVSIDGNDGWNGEHPTPSDDGADGPVRTIERAMEEVRTRRRAGTLGDCTVWLRGGRYELSEPLVFGPDDGNVTYAAYPGEDPVISGGRELDGWERTEVDGVDAWVTTVEDVADGGLNFRQLWVNGTRRFRPRTPNVGDLAFLGADDFAWIEDVPDMDDEDMLGNIFTGSDAFVAAEDDVGDWHAPEDVEAVVCHYWVGERLPIADIDPETGRVDLALSSGYGLIDDASGEYARYYFENVFEALSNPGEWYLDRATGRCYYLPHPDETRESVTVVVPVLDELVRVEGAEAGPVEDLRFEGISFAHTRYQYEESTSQAAASIGGAVSFEYARNCSLTDCTVANIGGYAVELGPGTRRSSVVANAIYDLGAGGITADGKRWDAAGRTGHNRITDNHIHDGGHVHHAAVGVLARNVFDTEIAHNHVHDFYYTGVSCGWEWGYDPQVAADNRIEHNHIHDLGKELLSDMGGIYTLGVQPGTVVRGNHIHDIHHWNYGGWAIYLDEGSSHILVEDNVCHDTSTYAFNQHYGRENLVRNNVFAYGEQGVVGLSRDEYTGYRWRRELVIHPNRQDPYSDRYPHLAFSRGPRGGAFTFLQNVVVGDAQPLLVGTGGDYGSALSDHPITSEANLFWDESGDAFCVDAGDHEDPDNRLALDEWRDLGNDATSLVVDPGMSVDGDGVAFASDSPAMDVGFEPIRLRTGPRID